MGIGSRHVAQLAAAVCTVVRRVRARGDGLQLVDAVLVLQDRRREVGEVFHFRNDGGAVGLNRVAGAEAPATSEARFPGLILALVERLMLGLYLSQGRRKAQSN